MTKTISTSMTETIYNILNESSDLLSKEDVARLKVAQSFANILSTQKSTDPVLADDHVRNLYAEVVVRNFVKSEDLVKTMLDDIKQDGTLSSFVFKTVSDIKDKLEVESLKSSKTKANVFDILDDLIKSSAKDLQALGFEVRPSVEESDARTKNLQALGLEVKPFVPENEVKITNPCKVELDPESGLPVEKHNRKFSPKNHTKVKRVNPKTSVADVAEMIGENELAKEWSYKTAKTVYPDLKKENNRVQTNRETDKADFEEALLLVTKLANKASEARKEYLLMKRLLDHCAEDIKNGSLGISDIFDYEFVSVEDLKDLFKDV